MDSRLSARALAMQLGGWRTREPAYEALADGIRVLCLDGRIAPRTALPAERELAVALGVSRTTIATAYRSLRDSGHIESVRGSGSVTLPGTRSRGAALGAREGDLDLQQACPPSWPGLGGVVSDVMASATTLLSRHGFDTVGSTGLRRAIADRYTRSGVPTAPEEIMATSGAQSAIHLLSSLLISRGDRAVIETPTYPHAAEALRRAGARLVPVPVSAESGWDIDRATQAFARTLPTVAYLMPDFQNPTGSSMGAEEREAIIAAAARSGTVLLIDETTADLDIDRGSFLPPFGAGERGGVELVRIGSLGKTVWGGLRVGWIRADASLIRRLAALRSAHDLGTPELEQAIAQRLVESLDVILPQRSDLLREGRDAATAALARRLPEWDVPRPSGGVALWIGLDAPLSTSLVLDARASGLLVSAGPLFGVDGGHDARLRLPYTVPPADLERAVAILADSWERVRDGAPADLVGRLESVV